MSVWQPIETAPKDGTPILIYEPPYFDATPHATYVCSWDTYKEAWVEHSGECYAQYEPTHWMPLPEPPTQE